MASAYPPAPETLQTSKDQISKDQISKDKAAREQARLDAELEGTFPASDPPAITRPRTHSLKSDCDARARAEAVARRAERGKA